jgi:hypothetical protein
VQGGRRAHIGLPVALNSADVNPLHGFIYNGLARYPSISYFELYFEHSGGRVRAKGDGWMQSAQDTNQKWLIVNTVMKFRVP